MQERLRSWTAETMSGVTTRRKFLALAAASIVQPWRFSTAAEPITRTRPSHLKLSLAAYSYRKYLTGAGKSMDLFDFVSLAADLGLDAIEPTAYYFPEDVSAEYLHRLRQRAFLLGLDISGTAIMSDFCVPAGPDADKELAHARNWIDHAAQLCAPVIRLLSGNWIQGTPDEELEQRVVDRINSLVPYARDRGVVLALENHGGGVTVSADQLVRIARGVKGDNFGVNLDTGNFHGEDPYAELAQAAPYAVNVQVKTEIRRKGKMKEPADLEKVIGILRGAKYSGYVVLEYTADEDPKTAVPRYIKQLRSLIG
jgi:sugar phosphate isomerase/epimerase